MDLDLIYQGLKKEGYIKYGVTISREVLERHFDLKYNPTGWVWTGPILQLSEYLKEMGYFTTQRGQLPGYFRIMHPSEYAKKVKNTRENAIKRQKKAREVCENVDYSLLTDKQAQELQFELTKMSNALHATMSILADL